MKRISGIFILIALLITTSACNRSENTSHIGVNAEILEMSKEVHGLVVKALDENSVLGEKGYINCEAPEMHYIYANNETGETVDLEYDDLKVGDQITVDVKSVENKSALTSKIQLLTQRK